MKVSIVGPIKSNAKEGKTNPKIFIYRDAIESIGYETMLFSTSVSKFKPISFLKSMKQSIVFGDTVLLMLGGRASRSLLKIFLFFNKKLKKRLILCPFGIGPLNPILKNKSIEFTNLFFSKPEETKLNDSKFGKKLKLLDLIVVQNNTLKKCFETFYKLDNVFVLPNFRLIDDSTLDTSYRKNSIVYVSRVNEEKGIIDLIKSVSSINESALTDSQISLDIYGEMHLSDKMQDYFNSQLNDQIKYFGPVPNKKVNDIISSHALSSLPTKYVGEGTPGFLVESLIAGVPSIVSSFAQAKDIIEDGFDGLIFQIGNQHDLTEKIKSIIYDNKRIELMRQNAYMSGKKYLFKNNIDKIKLILEGK